MKSCVTQNKLYEESFEEREEEVSGQLLRINGPKMLFKERIASHRRSRSKIARHNYCAKQWWKGGQAKD